MPHPDPFFYGSIPIYRYEILSLRTESSINQYTVERVSWPTKIVTQGNEYSYINLTLKVEQSSYDLWLAYFTNAPTNLQQTLDLGIFTLVSAALESMNVDVIKVINTSLNTFKYMYKLDLAFIRAI